MLRRLSLSLLLLALLPLPGAGPAHAAKQSAKWTKLSLGKVVNFFEPALWRDGDGVLHVVWGETDDADSYRHITIADPGSKTGTVTGASVALADWESLNGPVLVPDGAGGMRLLFSGIRNLDPQDPYAEGAVYHSTSPDGEVWTLGAGSLSSDGHAYASTGIGGALTSNGTPIASWSWTGGVYTHAGISPTIPSGGGDAQHQSACCGYHTNLATDEATSETFLVWYSNADDLHGIWFRRVAPTLGSSELLPGSRGDENSPVNPSQRVPAVARTADGVYTAYCTGYPTCKKVRVMRLNDLARWDIPGSKGADSVQLSTGRSGRIWVLWAADEKIYARTSNQAGDRWGAVVSIAPPKNTGSIWNVNGEGSLGRLDVIANLSRNGEEGFWHTRLLAPLQLRVTPGKIAAHKKVKVTFFVHVAGDPVAGAHIGVAGKTATTLDDGLATLKLKLKPGTYQVKATAPGFQTAIGKVKAVT